MNNFLVVVLVVVGVTCCCAARLSAEECASVAAATHIWDVSCHHFSNATKDCYSAGTLPDKTSVVLFPAGSDVILAAKDYLSFPLHLFRSVVVEQGAKLWMQGESIQITECFVVKGTLRVEAEGKHVGASPFSEDYYLPDPSQPEGTDCKTVGGGFNPRICGPGILRIDGVLTIAAEYSSVFSSVLVSTSGKMLLQDHGFLWGRLTNYGTFETSGYVYMHGFLYNYGTASLFTAAFDKWVENGTYADSPPLLIENHKLVKITSLMINTITYDHGYSKLWRAVLVNYDQALVEGYLTQNEFDVFNFGTVTWRSLHPRTNHRTFEGLGSFVSRGTFIADGCSVYLSTYHGSDGAKLVTINRGEFSFGNGLMDTKSLNVCILQPKEEPKVVARPPAVLESQGCWWYGQFCYPHPYSFFAAPPTEKKERPRSTILFEMSRIVADSAIPSPCLDRYTFGDVSIGGDGTGSVVTTLPSNVYGTVTIGKGGKWIMIAEHHTSPVWGAGTVRVAKLGELHVGIDATLDNHNSFVVEEGGLMTVPKHADVSLTNTTVTIRRGGILHVDGVLHHDAKASELNQCGMLRGAGNIRRTRPFSRDC